MIVHRFADFLQLGHISEDLPEARANSRDPTRQLTVTKLPEPCLELQDQATEVEGVVAVEVYDTSKIGPVKKARLGRANLPWIEVATLPYHAKPQMPLRVLRIAGHPHDGGREHGGRRSEYVNIAPALEEVSFDSGSSHARRHGDDGTHLHKEWRWVCSDCSTKLQHRLVFTRIGAVVDWYMSRGSRGGYGKLVRRVFSILEDRAEPAANAAEYFLVPTCCSDCASAGVLGPSGTEAAHSPAPVAHTPARHANNTRNNTHSSIAERKLQPVMAWDVEDRKWRAISPDGRHLQASPATV